MAAARKQTAKTAEPAVKVDDEVELEETVAPSEMIITEKPGRNSTFADRAKAAGRNKRVATSDSK